MLRNISKLAPKLFPSFGLVMLAAPIYRYSKMAAAPSKRMKLDNKKFNNEDNDYDNNKIFISENIEEIEAVQIDILNDDCMEMIFSYLDLVDLIRIERVSKRWRDLSLKTWINHKKINTEEDFNPPFDTKHLEDVLKRCGDHLTHLDVRDEGKISIPVVINRYCRNLKHLGVITYKSCKNDWQELDDFLLKNLKSLKFEDRCTLKLCRHKFKSHLLKKGLNLEEVHLSVNYGFKGTCLLHLTEKCTSLSIGGCEQTDPEVFTNVVLNRIPRLEKLDISDTHILPENLQTISNQLHLLSVRRIQSNFFPRSRYKFLSFHNLRILNVSFNFDVNDECLSVLISNCPLIENLNIAGCTNIGEKGFLELRKLKKLHSLDLSFCRITDTNFHQLAKVANKLKNLNCYGCRHITDTGLIAFVTSCSELTYLQLVLNYKIGPLFFQSALERVELRPNNLPLTIHIASSFDQHNIEDEIKRLRLTKRNNRPARNNVCKVKITDFRMIKKPLGKMETWYVAKP